MTGKTTAGGWQFWIDRGGTFTDVVARRPDGALLTHKLLSDNPEHYRDAAIQGIRDVLGLAPGEPVRGVEAVKMGTTVATNALLERKGDRTLLAVNRGFRDALRIGDQTRPHLFDLRIVLPEMLYERVIEVDGRVGAGGEVLVPLDCTGAEAAMRAAYAEGIRSIAIVFMHGYRYPEHELTLARLARAIGFTQVSTSYETSPLMKLVGRGDTTVVDAYLSPLLRRYVEQVAAELGEGVRLMFMQSNGGLVDARRFRGKDAILSGPAGGVVGAVETAARAGHGRIISFDMGGTSTDVAHYDGAYERTFETLVAGVRMRAPMMMIHTVAAGGGSICSFDGARYRVGPESAGADPGPACYRRGGPLCVTDCNVLLGKLQPEFFPRVFGPNQDEPLDREMVVRKLKALAAGIGARAGAGGGGGAAGGGEDGSGSGAARRPRPAAVEAAEGFLRIAVDNMANAIKAISVRRGYDVTGYTLNCFGGAGGQHACLVADALGMTRVMIHPFAGVLSAYGTGLADVRVLRDRAVEARLDDAAADALGRVLDDLAEEACAELAGQGIGAERVRVFRRTHLRYEGTDTPDLVEAGDARSMKARFEDAHRRRYGFVMPEKALVIEAASVEAVGSMEEAGATGGAGHPRAAAAEVGAPAESPAAAQAAAAGGSAAPVDAGAPADPSAAGDAATLAGPSAAADVGTMDGSPAAAGHGHGPAPNPESESGRAPTRKVDPGRYRSPCRSRTRKASPDRRPGRCRIRWRGSGPGSTARSTTRRSTGARPSPRAAPSTVRRSSSNPPRPRWWNRAGGRTPRLATPSSWNGSFPSPAHRPPAPTATRCCWRCSTTASCPSPSRWDSPSRTPPSPSTSRSGSISRARFSTRTGCWSPTRRTSRSISAP